MPKVIDYQCYRPSPPPLLPLPGRMFHCPESRNDSRGSHGACHHHHPPALRSPPLEFASQDSSWCRGRRVGRLFQIRLLIFLGKVSFNPVSADFGPAFSGEGEASGDFWHLSLEPG